MNIKKSILIGALGIYTISFFFGCSTVAVDEDAPPENQFAEGERLFKKDRFLEANERFRILKNRHPYSIYAALATLRIADVYFAEESYLEAASAYRVFLDLYPRHKESPYAVFRTGESNYALIPDTIDRDISSAHTAIQAYRRLLREYPKSKYEERANKNVVQLRRFLAEKEAYIADFYFIRDQFTAAAGRYRGILDKFSGLGHNEVSLFRLAFSYQKLGTFTRASEAIEHLLLRFPKGEYAKKAKELQETITQEKK